jgi:hypothetical protein
MKHYESDKCMKLMREYEMMAIKSLQDVLLFEI